jgi:ketosteroid isomerase-like protein
MTPAHFIQEFYTAFQHKDYATMQSFYHDKAVFNDPAFINLNSAEVKAMWEMLIKRGKDLSLSFSHIKDSDTTGSANWAATYTFSATGKKVTNNIHSEFVFENGRIIQQTDTFDFYKWSRQAFGIKGWLLGWTSFFRKKVQEGARKNLIAYMEKNK